MIGLDVATMTTSERGWLNSYFNNNLRSCWTYANWFDLCPVGEARFVNNLLTSGNDVSNASYWITQSCTPTTTTVSNPLDGRQNVSKFLELAATNGHGVTYTGAVDMTASATFTASVYVRTIGGRWLRLQGSDGVTTYTAFFDLVNGVVGTVTAAATSSISPLANGFYLCQLNFTAGAAPVDTGTLFKISTSSNGSSSSFLGDVTKGLYVYGAVFQQTSLLSDKANLLPWIQAGESEIDAFYNAYRNAPFSANSPTKLGYNITNNGIQLIGSSWNLGYILTPTGTTYTSGNTLSGVVANPVYIYYRAAPFSYFGAAWSGTLTYAVGDIAQFTNPTTSVINYYTCFVATTAGQSPVTTPASWSLNWIPDVLFQYCVYKGYADWLRTDGQFDKANAQEGLAQTVLENEFDTQEREMGMSAPLRVQTHLTSR